MSFRKFGRMIGCIAIGAMFMTLTGCFTDATDTTQQSTSGGGTNPSLDSASQPTTSGEFGTATPGTDTYRGFVMDNVLHSPDDGDIHFHIHIPDSYDSSTPVALFLTLPGYQGLYFQGVGKNLYTEDFGFEAQRYDDRMIIVAPQLSDWGETSARQAIALTEYLLDAYAIDATRVFAEGYSGGGETMSRVMGMRPDLFSAYLHCSSRWDGDIPTLIESETPVYLVVGHDDEYYGSEPSETAYHQIHDLYANHGLTEDQIDDLVILDVKDADYFTDQGVTNQHGGGSALFSHDPDIMGWLFNR